MKRHIPLLLLAGVLAGAVTGTILDHRAEASRNSGGTYSLPTGNPVVTGTTISSTWANNTLTDIGTELTNSLDRQGRGAMTAPLQHSSGSAAAPSVTFSAETASGLYRAGANNIGMSVASGQRQSWTSTGTVVLGTLTASGTSTFASNANVGTGLTIDTSGSNVGTSANALSLGGGGEAIGSRRTAGTGQNGLDLYTANTARLSITNAGGILIPGAYSATPGTAITASYAASPSLTYTLGIASSNSTTTTVTGASTNSTCEVSAGTGVSVSVSLRCYVSAANTVTVVANNTDNGAAHNVSAVQHFIRVWNN